MASPAERERRVHAPEHHGEHDVEYDDRHQARADRAARGDPDALRSPGREKAFVAMDDRDGEDEHQDLDGGIDQVGEIDELIEVVPVGAPDSPRKVITSALLR